MTLIPWHERELYDSITETAKQFYDKDQPEVKRARWSRRLTLHEVEILLCVSHGMTNAEIGQKLGISPLTVKAHLARIAKVMGKGRREVMVLEALRLGLIS